jgi:4-hydroxy-4-methyl-2-oxoglutarate aldolase
MEEEKMMIIDTAVLNKLRRFDTPTICNVIELFDVRPRIAGFMDGRIRANFPELQPMVGFASTATFRASIPPRDGDSYHHLTDHIAHFEELSGPPVVVFQDLDNPARAAAFGEIMCTAYQAFGAVGLVTSGAGRDLEQVRRLAFPVFTAGTICAHGYCSIVDVNVPVHVGGIAIYPDDLLHGDLNGVTTIPRDIASDVADVAEEFVAAEAIILEALKNKPVSISTLHEATDTADERINAIRQRVAWK